MKKLTLTPFLACCIIIGSSDPVNNAGYKAASFQSLDAKNSSVHKDGLTDTAPGGFIGDWVGINNDGKNAFTISLSERKDSVIGTYCYIMNSGAKMDCRDNDYSFSFKNNPQPSQEISFRSAFNDAWGLGRITLLRDTLHWEIMDEPSGEYYCPKRSVLVRHR